MARALFQLVSLEYFAAVLIICMLLGGTESHRYCACLFSSETPSFPQICDETKEIMAVDSAYISHSENCVLGRDNLQNCECACPIENGSTQALLKLFKDCGRIPINRCLESLKYFISQNNMTEKNFITVDYFCVPKPRRYCSCISSGLYEDFASTCDEDEVVVIVDAFVHYGPVNYCQQSDVESRCDQVIPWLPRSRLESFTSSCTGETPATCRARLRNTSYPEAISGPFFSKPLFPNFFFIEYRCIHLSSTIDMCNHPAETKLNTNSTYISSPGYPNTTSTDYGSCRCNVTSTTNEMIQVLRWAVQFEVADDSCVEVTTQGTRGSCLEYANSTDNVQTPFSITYTGTGKNDNRFLFWVQGKEPIDIHCRRLDDDEDNALKEVSDVISTCESSETHISSPGFPKTLSMYYGSCQCDVTSFSKDEVNVFYSVLTKEMPGNNCVKMKRSGLPVRCLRSSDSNRSVQTPFSVTYEANERSEVKVLIRVQGKKPVNIHCSRMDAKSEPRKRVPVTTIAAAAAAGGGVLIVGAIIIFCCLRRKRSTGSANSTSAISKHPNTATVEIPESTPVKSHPDTPSHQTTAVDNVYHSGSETQNPN